MKNKNTLIDEKKNIQNQVMWNRLLSVVEEQGQTLVRTAFSPIVRECGDISAGVFDLEGRMMAQAVTGTPVMLILWRSLLSILSIIFHLTQ